MIFGLLAWVDAGLEANARRIDEAMREGGYSNRFYAGLGEFWIRPTFGDERLARPGGWADDIKLATILATDLVGVFDPTGVSDLLGGALRISEGQGLDGLLQLAGGAVPFVNAKFGCSAATALNSAVNLGQAGLGINDGIESLRNDDPLGATISFLGAGVSLLGAGQSFCFVAGTQVVIDFEQDAGVRMQESGVRGQESAESAAGFLADAVTIGLWVGLGAYTLHRARGGSSERDEQPRLAVRRRRRCASPPIALPDEQSASPSLLPREGGGEGGQRPDEGAARFTRSASAASADHKATDALFATNSHWDDAPPSAPRHSESPRIDTRPPSRLRPLWIALSFLGFLFLSGYTLHRGLDRLAATPALASAPAPPKPAYRTQSIETIEPGQTVLAMDPETGRLEQKEVLHTFERVADHLQLVTLRDVDGHVQTLQTTDEHPVWVPARREWVKAKDLQIADAVLGPTGEAQFVTRNVHEAHPEGITVYNFEVEGFHSYFVATDAGRDSVLVHNASKKKYGGNDLEVVPRRDMSERTVKDVRGRGVSIFGQSGSSSKTLGHDRKIHEFAEELAKSGKYKYVTMQRSWRTATGRIGKSRRIPDIIAVRHSGKVYAWEVISNSDKTDELLARLAEGRNDLPAALRGLIKFLKP